MAMSQEVSFRCMQCKNSFELTIEQVDDFMACGTVECSPCSQRLRFKEHDVAKLVEVKRKNRRRIWIFGCLTIGLPLLNILVILKWGAGMGFIGFFVIFLVLVSVVPALKDISFVLLDLEPDNQVMQD